MSEETLDKIIERVIGEDFDFSPFAIHILVHIENGCHYDTYYFIPPDAKSEYYQLPPIVYTFYNDDDEDNALDSPEWIIDYYRERGWEVEQL